jgi:hypothetical protein
MKDQSLREKPYCVIKMTRGEKEAAGLVNQLKLSRSWATLVNLGREIGLAHRGLAEEKVEIKQHQSWLERLLRRKARGDE